MRLMNFLFAFLGGGVGLHREKKRWQHFKRKLINLFRLIFSSLHQFYLVYNKIYALLKIVKEKSHLVIEKLLNVGKMPRVFPSTLFWWKKVMPLFACGKFYEYKNLHFCTLSSSFLPPYLSHHTTRHPHTLTKGIRMMLGYEEKANSLNRQKMW